MPPRHGGQNETVLAVNRSLPLNWGMDWNDKFSRQTQWMKRSAVRELLKLTARPEVISFAGGLPAPELFPVREIEAAAAEVWKRRPAAALQYGETEGVGELRDWIAARFSRADLTLRRENVLITSGSQQGLDLIGRILLNPHDRVVVENPSYLAMFSAWRPQQANFVPVASDADGMVIAAIAEISEPLKMIYLNPDFQNPQGTTLSLARRVGLSAILKQKNIALIEDNPYADLRFEGSSLPSVFQLNAVANANGVIESQVIQLGSFSKILAPGLRLGWVIAEEAVIDKLTLAKQACDLHTSSLAQHIVLELARSGVIDRQIPHLQSAYRERRDAMVAALETFFPEGVSWTRPEGGMFLMVRLPKGADAEELLRRALKLNVAFVPGRDFHCNGLGQNTLRLNFSCAKPALISEGIGRLAKALGAM